MAAAEGGIRCNIDKLEFKGDRAMILAQMERNPVAYVTGVIPYEEGFGGRMALPKSSVFRVFTLTNDYDSAIVSFQRMGAMDMEDFDKSNGGWLNNKCEIEDIR